LELMPGTAILSKPKELSNFVCAGRLYDIKRWVQSDRSLELPLTRSGRRKTMLRAAVETGFHSLVADAIRER
jgi:hypothetical protein